MKTKIILLIILTCISIVLNAQDYNYLEWDNSEEWKAVLEKSMQFHSASKEISLDKLADIQMLDLSNTKITDFSNLSNFPNIKILCLRNTAFSNNDLKYLNNMQLDILDLESTKVTNLTKLKVQKKLERLWLKNTNISNLSGLERFVNLKAIDISGTKVKKLHNISLLPIEKLYMANTKINDISDIASLKKLIVLDADIAFLQKVDKQIFPNIKELTTNGKSLEHNKHNKHTSKGNSKGDFTNIDFEMGNFTGWIQLLNDDWTTSNYYTTSSSNKIEITNAGNDPHIPEPQVYPLGGTHSACLGADNAINCGAEMLKRDITVEEGTEIVQYALFLILEDPGHNPEEQPRFEFIIRNSYTFEILECGYFQVTAGQGIPGFIEVGGLIYLPWTVFAVNLSDYIGQRVEISVSNLDCALYGHWSKSYIDFLLPTASIEGAYICEGDPTTLVAPPGFINYSWNTGETGRTLPLNDPQNGEIYTVSYTTIDGGCEFSSSVAIEVLAYPTPDIGDDIIKCQNSSYTLSANSLADSYQWFLNNAPIGNEYNLEITEAGIYKLTATNGGKCATDDQISVVLSANFELGNDINKCYGTNDTTIIDASQPSGSYTYAWSTGSDEPQIKIYLPGSTVISCIRQDLSTVNECYIEDDVIITYVVPPVVEAENTEYGLCCPDLPVEITINADESTTTSWSTGDFGSSIVLSYCNVEMNLVATTYHSEAPVYCPTETNIFYKTTENPKINFAEDTIRICGNEDVFPFVIPIEVEENQERMKYAWKVNNEITTNIDSILELQTTGVFDIVVFVIDTLSGGCLSGDCCFSTDTIFVEIIPPIESPIEYSIISNPICVGFSDDFTVATYMNYENNYLVEPFFSNSNLLSVSEEFSDWIYININNNVCALRDSFYLELYHYPKLKSLDTTICWRESDMPNSIFHNIENISNPAYTTYYVTDGISQVSDKSIFTDIINSFGEYIYIGYAIDPYINEENGGCIDSTFIIFNVLPEPIMNLVVPEEICGDTAIIELPYNPIQHPDWNFYVNEQQYITNDFNLIGTGEQNFTAQLIVNTGCRVTKKFNILFKELPNIDIKNITVCYPSGFPHYVEYKDVAGITQFYEYITYKDDNIIGNNTGFNFTDIKQIGLYTVKVTDPFTNCYATKDFNLNIKFDPIFTIDIVKQDSLPYLTTINETNLINHKINWDFMGDINISKDSLYAYTYTYDTLNISIRDEFGCITKLDTILLPEASELQMPTAFTPNGDGKNDYFCGIARGLETFTIKIYDLNGKIVFFEHLSIYDGWNGYFYKDKGWNGWNTNGKPYPDGYYEWKINYSYINKDNKEQHKELNGKVRLIGKY